MLILNSENFESEVLQSRILVLVDFYADWCGPCQAMGPVIEELDGKEGKEGKVKVGKVNVDENQALAEKYGVMSIPTLIAFKNGEETNRKVGVITKEELIKLVI